jgi:acyl transferase domain-containing protein
MQEQALGLEAYLAALQQSAVVIQKLQAEVDAYREPIAVIGMACRFPGGANTPAQFWQLLRDGVDAITDFPTERLPPGAAKPAAPLKGGFLNPVDSFDAPFFGIAPREATSMDPQQRLLLEVSWEALENAGIVPDGLYGSKTGVFIGICASDYQRLVEATDLQRDGLYAATGNALSVAAGRLAYTMGLNGPCVALDTACSSSLVAVYEACQSLRNQACSLALAGGVNLILRTAYTEVLTDAHMLAPDGRCKTFDAAANGFVRSEGCGVVVLKRLTQAQADGDPILAVIRGAVINQDGRSSGLTAPSGAAQRALLKQALTEAKVEPTAVTYMEAHGTGTALGDPIEIGALSAVYGKRTQPLWVGSVKSNIGHLEGAAGIASLVKVILALQHGELPPNLHFTHPNPYIDWGAAPLQIPTAPTLWPRAGATHQRIAGVSAFGFSGTNAHLLVEEAPAVAAKTNAAMPPAPHLLLLAAQTPSALVANAQHYAAFLQTQPADNLGDICYSSRVGRSHFRHRLAVVGSDQAQMVAALAAYQQGQPSAGLVQSEQPAAATPPSIAFLFTGQGAQYPGMGRALYASQPVFRRALERCAELLRAELDQPLLEILYPTTRETAPEGQRLIDQTIYTQPALFALEYALAQLWLAWGVQPALLLGHSVGEVVAACVAGVFSLEDGVKLIAARGRLMQRLPQDGAMVALNTDETEAQTLIAAYSDVVSIAAVNGPENVVISGQRTAVEAICQQVIAAGGKVRFLPVSHAFHSPLMAPMLADFSRVAATITYRPPTLPIVSNLTGKLATTEIATPDYWVRHVRHAVRFADGVQTLAAQGCTVFVEIGPKPVLLGMAKGILDFGLSILASDSSSHQSKIQNPKSKLFLPSLREGQHDSQQILESLGHLFVQNVAVDWGAFDQGQPWRKVALPTYAFQRQRYWVEPYKQNRQSALRPLIDRMIKSPLLPQILFESDFSLDRLPFLRDHTVYDSTVTPAACQVALALSAAELAWGDAALVDAAIVVADVLFPAALAMPTAGIRKVQVLLTPHAVNGSGPHADFQLISFDPDDKTMQPDVMTHATGQLLRSTAKATPVLALSELQQQCTDPIDVTAYYAMLASAQIGFGPTLRWLEQLWCGVDTHTGQSLARLRLPAAVTTMAGYLIHPGLLDACFQVAGASRIATDKPQTFMTFAVGRVAIHRIAQGEEWWCHARATAELTWDIQLFDTQGRLMADIQGFTLRPAAALLQSLASWRELLYHVEWQPQPIFGEPAAHLPAPATIRAMALTRIQDELASTSLTLSRYNAALIGLEEASVAYVLAAFAQGGVTFHADGQWTTAQISAQLGLLPKYQRLLNRLLEMLCEVEILQRTADDHWLGLRTPARIEPDWQIAELQQRHADVLGAETVLLQRCARALYAILCGLQDPLDLLFPNGDDQTVRQLYVNTPAAQVINRTAQAVLQSALADLPANRGVRILEIGGGTGSTTASLLPILPATQTEYCFTDLGATFTARAKSKFAAYGFIDYRTLDIEQDPLAQGFAAQHYDIVVAANVLHATENLPQTLAHARQLLAPGGLLLMVEGTSRNRWVDLTFGLTDGWWRSTDSGRDHPLLTTDQWETLLRANGFDSVRAIPADSAELPLDHAIIFARADAAREKATQSWLLLADQAGVGRTLADRLRAQGDTVYLVHASDTYAEIDKQQYMLRPAAAADYQSLLAALPRFDHLVHLWGIDAPPAATLTAPLVTQAALDSCGAVLTLIQNILNRGAAIPKLWLVTQAAQAVDATTEVTGLAQSPLWGMARVIRHEHPELHCQTIDLAPGNANDAGESLVSVLYRETANASEAESAYRERQKFVPRLRRLPVAGGELAIHADATYLITGGLTGIGLAMAEWLVACGARHLALLGRRTPAPVVIDQLQMLRNQGATIQVFQTDVAQAEQVEQVFRQIAATGVPLRGIIHAAGIFDDSLLLNHSLEKYTNVFAAKVTGSWHLHTLSQSSDLDFFVLCSSTSALMGGTGLSNYAAANTFLGVLAHYRRQQGLPAICVDWGAWKDVGMAQTVGQQRQAQWEQVGLQMMDVAEVLAAFQHLLVAAPPQAAITRQDWRKAIAIPFLHDVRPKQIQATADKPQNFQHRWQETTQHQRRSLLTEWVQEAMAHILGMPKEQLDPQRSLLNAGLDSLMAMEARNRLRQLFAQDIPVTTFLEGITTMELIAILYEGLCPTEQSPSAGAEQPIALLPLQNDVETQDDLTEIEWLEGAL